MHKFPIFFITSILLFFSVSFYFSGYLFRDAFQSIVCFGQTLCEKAFVMEICHTFEQSNLHTLGLFEGFVDIVASNEKKHFLVAGDRPVDDPIAELVS